jgi:hypothetical protein
MAVIPPGNQTNETATEETEVVESQSVLGYFMAWIRGETNQIPNVALFAIIIGLVTFADMEYGKGKHVWLILLGGGMVIAMYAWFV